MYYQRGPEWSRVSPDISEVWWKVLQEVLVVRDQGLETLSQFKGKSLILV